MNMGQSRIRDEMRRWMIRSNELPAGADGRASMH